MKIRIFSFLAFCAFTTIVQAGTPAESRTIQYFNAIKNNPQQLTYFLTALPKGGDLHNHESGATWDENLLKYAANDNLCVDRTTYIASINTNCAPQDALMTAIKDPIFKDQLIDHWSMRHFEIGSESGHDHFFATFKKFSIITNTHRGEILSELVQRAAQENEIYLELMSTLDGNDSGKLGQQLGWDDNMTAMRDKLRAAGLDKIITKMSDNIDQDDAQKNTLLACGTADAQAGCNIKVRYLYQVLREQAPEMVFAQLVAGFEAASKDERIVGLNMVQPEDGTISMRDYTLQMQMIKFLRSYYPNVKITLHAGELTSALVPAEGLKFHIRDAVNVAGANRIGHGVDIAQEDGNAQTLKTMADNAVMVEINLSSNAKILNVQGKDHPLSLYLQNHVATALSTDDEGVARENMTKQYLRAVTDLQMDYLTLKQMARNSISYAFIKGDNLWQDHAYQQLNVACAKDIPGQVTKSPSCRAFLAQSEKAQLQWQLEKQITTFENQY